MRSYPCLSPEEAALLESLEAAAYRQQRALQRRTPPDRAERILREVAALRGPRRLAVNDRRAPAWKAGFERVLREWGLWPFYECDVWPTGPRLTLFTMLVEMLRSAVLGAFQPDCYPRPCMHAVGVHALVAECCRPRRRAHGHARLSHMVLMPYGRGSLLDALEAFMGAAHRRVPALSVAQYALALSCAIANTSPQFEEALSRVLPEYEQADFATSDDVHAFLLTCASASRMQTLCENLASRRRCMRTLVNRIQEEWAVGNDIVALGESAGDG